MAPRLSSTSAREAARLLQAGGLVGLPTETVYGLGALATDPLASARIFAAKGRPTNNPFIVHVRNPEAIGVWADNIPSYVHAITEEFWPGPLTLVLGNSGHAAPEVSAGLPTIALRSAAHPVFDAVLAELEALGVVSPGIAAPSANRFGRVSPTTADAVVEELGNVLGDGDAVVDGGECQVGVESTIVVCESDGFRVARPGAITADDLRTLAPQSERGSPDVPPSLPGSHESHYAPECRVHLVHSVEDLSAKAASNQVSGSVGIMGLAGQVAAAPPTMLRLTDANSAADLAHQLYAALRRADHEGVTDVYAFVPDGDGISIAVRDRLRRAASK